MKLKVCESDTAFTAQPVFFAVTTTKLQSAQQLNATNVMRQQ
jgi:hypothetical protein